LTRRCQPLVATCAPPTELLAGRALRPHEAGLCRIGVPRPPRAWGAVATHHACWCNVPASWDTSLLGTSRTCRGRTLSCGGSLCSPHCCPRRCNVSHTHNCRACRAAERSRAEGGEERWRVGHGDVGPCDMWRGHRASHRNTPPLCAAAFRHTMVCAWVGPCRACCAEGMRLPHAPADDVLTLPHRTHHSHTPHAPLGTVAQQVAILAWAHVAHSTLHQDQPTGLSTPRYNTSLQQNVATCFFSKHKQSRTYIFRIQKFLC
jgi:hypothetical protein